MLGEHVGYEEMLGVFVLGMCKWCKIPASTQELFEVAQLRILSSYIFPYFYRDASLHAFRIYMLC